MKTTAVFIILVLGGSLVAQDTLTLWECHRHAYENSPRLLDQEFIRQIGALKVDNASTRWYPALDLNGRLSYQSDVVTIALSDPGIPVSFPEVPRDQYGLNLDISQTLYDGGITKQKKSVELSSAAADLQQVEVDLYGLKARVNQFFFAILVLQENRNNLEIHLENLQQRRGVMQSAIANGTLLESELKVIDVEILKVQQSMVEIDTQKGAFLGALAILCGDEIQSGIQLEKPDLEFFMEDPDRRPEIRWFELKNASMEAGKELISKQRMPVLYAFGQTGYGKPGYNMLSGEWDFYYMVGAGLRWKIWDWNSSNRERQVIEQQQHMLMNQRASFEREMESLKVQEKARIEQYRRSMELEKQVLSLQQEISESAASQLANGTITATEYITELNKESITRIKLATQQLKLMQSIANYLTIKGNI